MKYSDVVKLGEINNIHIETHVIPLGMAWRVVDYNAEVITDIKWSDVSVQTDLRLTEDILDRLKFLIVCPDEQLEIIVKELGYKGVLIVVATTKQLDNSGRRRRYTQHYAYLADPEWSEVGTEMGLLVERVIASWHEAS